MKSKNAELKDVVSKMFSAIKNGKPVDVDIGDVLLQESAEPVKLSERVPVIDKVGREIGRVDRQQIESILKKGLHMPYESPDGEFMLVYKGDIVYPTAVESRASDILEIIKVACNHLDTAMSVFDPMRLALGISYEVKGEPKVLFISLSTFATTFSQYRNLMAAGLRRSLENMLENMSGSEPFEQMLDWLRKNYMVSESESKGVEKNERKTVASRKKKTIRSKAR